MAKSFYDYISAGAIALYWEAAFLGENEQYLGTSLFPARKQTGLDLSWVKGQNQMPVVLQPSAFDTVPALRDRIGMAKIETELPFYREAMRLGEQDRQNIETFLARGFDFAKPIIGKVFDDAANLIRSAEVSNEVARFNILFFGKHKFEGDPENGRPVYYEYDYDPTGTWAANNNAELLTTAQWTSTNAATSKPLEDLEALIISMRETSGVEPTRAIMNTTTLNGMLASESIKKAMNPVGHANSYVSKSAAKAFVQSELGIEIIVYDKQFSLKQGGATKKYVPDNMVALLGANPVGRTIYGTTPEEFDLLGNTLADGVDVKVVNTGVAVVSKLEYGPPVNMSTIVSQVSIPSFEDMDNVFILKTKSA